MSRARSVLSARSRQNSSEESEPLYSVLNSVNVFLGNSIIRKVIHGLCVDDKQAIYEALSLYSGQNDLHLLKKLKLLPICAFVELGRMSFHVDRPKMQEYFSQQVTRRGLSNIVKSIAEYGISKPLKLQAPFLVVWNYTDACNLRCKHCYQGAGKMSKDELSLDERLNIVDQLADNDVVAIAFSGGEALLRDDFWEVARYASSKGLYLSLATNGTLLTKDVVRRLRDVGVEYFEISLDSVDPVKHDAFRGVNGAWERTVAGIKNVVAQDGAYSCIANTITNENYRELDALVALSRKLGVNRTLIFNFIPVGRGSDIIDMDLPPDAREHVLQQMYEYLSGQDESFEILTTAPQFSRVCMMNSQNGIISLAHFGAAGFSDKVGLLAEYIGGCGAGRMYCAIQPNGIVTPCVFMPIPVGDLRSESFVDIWKNAAVMQSLRERHELKEHCGSCDYKNVCGGCRARAYAYFNDIKAPDIGCIYNLRAYNALKDKLRATNATVETTEAVESSF
ncbi:MAG: radical SAM protein [Halobacteriota archaeon]|jgi:radical SAM protein with 4Fe4S-binding SPASM domain